MYEFSGSTTDLDSRDSYRKWGILIACFLASAVTVGGSQYSFGHFVEPLQEAFGWSRTEIGLSLSLVALGSFISPLIGSLIDRHGARPIMTFCLVMFALSYLARPFMTHISHWYILGIIQSFTIAGANILPTGKLIGLWFPKNRGKILGIAAMGNNFGGIAVQPAVSLIISVYSWQMGYAAIGIFAIVVSVYSFFMVRDPVSSLSSDGSTQEIDLVGFTLNQAFHMRKFYVIIVAFMCGTFTYSALLPQVSSHLINNGINDSTVALAVSLFATCGMVGKFIFGIMSDKFGPRPAMIIDLYGQSIFASLLVFAGTSVPLWLVVPLMGFFLGAETAAVHWVWATARTTTAPNASKASNSRRSVRSRSVRSAHASAWAAKAHWRSTRRRRRRIERACAPIKSSAPAACRRDRRHWRACGYWPDKPPPKAPKAPSQPRAGFAAQPAQGHQESRKFH